MRATDLNLRHLRAVLAIHRHGSISGAAREVNLTQPAITQGLARVEQQLGLSLFERSSGGMTPTAAADLLVPRIEAALHRIASPRVTAAQMRSFLALARAGSYAGAAQAIGTSEPSLHRAVRDLSLALGRELVERRGRGVALTAKGRGLARALALAGAELEAGLEEVAALAGRETGCIAIGAMPLCRARLLPSAIARFHARFPDYRVVVAEGSHAELVGPLREGELDLLIGALREPSAGPDLNQQPLFEDRPVVVARAGHPLAGSRPSLETLASYPWTIAASGAPLRDHWESMFTGHGLSVPRVPVECGSVITIRQLLMSSDFLTLLSPDQVAVELEAGWLTVIGPAPPDIVRTIGVTTRAGWRPTPLQRHFLAELGVQSS
ncbi:LysR family transcriptional regulator [Sphingomonas piscis]|uniref:LysR family transcriptional regulator n=1 Tax=Sphingomonas piscis TaxID=2714943 RepID=A0A6G7YM26_9SPHN|nr:LysR substrate-binding domain-containing protein [Sphingomonas piscis]QIK77791.1 LysR family transcriptional regulator [Sphingomonas piscis]